jgi:hypothetical protein
MEGEFANHPDAEEVALEDARNKHKEISWRNLHRSDIERL